MTYGTLLSTQTVSTATSSITFSSIPQTYTDLILVISTRSTLASNYSDTFITFNGSTTGYTNKWIQGSGSAASSSGNTANGVNILLDGATSVANTFANAVIHIPNYTGSNNKVVMFDGVEEDNATLSYIRIGSTLWANTAAISSLTLTDSANYVAGSMVSLYGINPIVTATGTTPTVDLLVVGGGGSGGGAGGSSAASAGGGGAGGLLTFTAQTVSSGTAYTVTVGAGGAQPSNDINGNPGNNSQFGALTAAVGGGYGATYANNGGAGGSGGGGGGNGVHTGGAGTTGQGNTGGTGNSSGNLPGGGGGGAGAAASAQTGGNGVVSTITGFSTYYAGGGGGGGYDSGYGIGGIGGGGNGGYYVSSLLASAGQMNTGGGGGGGPALLSPTAGYRGGAGGSGVVVLRYLQTYNPAYVTGNPEINYVNGYRVYTWYASGLVMFGTPSFITSGLKLYLDAGNSTSYSGSGSTWTDLSGSGNNVTLYNSPGYSSSNSGYLTFNGSNQYGAAPAGMANFTTGLTVCALVNFGTANNWERIIDFGNGAPSDTFLFARNGTSNTISAQVSNGTTNQLTHEIANTITNNGWGFYTWTLDGTTSTVGVNGAYYTQASTVLPTNITRNNVYIGRSEWAGDAYFDSGMQVISVYNRALTQAETTQNFNAVRARFGL